METWEIRPSQGLPAVVLQEVRELARICSEHDGGTAKLNWDMLADRPVAEINDFLAYDQGSLIGFLALYDFGRPEVELNGLVHPAHRRHGLFRTLLGYAAGKCAGRGLPKMILICDRDVPAGAAFARAAGAVYDFSEYGMELTRVPANLLPPPEGLTIARAAWADREEMAAVGAACFGDSLEAVLRSLDRLCKPNCSGLIVHRQGRVIGQVLVLIESDCAYICALGVLPEERKRGAGRFLLRQAMDLALSLTTSPVRLEVNCANPGALELYLSSGFAVTTTYDYYAIPTEKAARA